MSDRRILPQTASGRRTPAERNGPRALVRRRSPTQLIGSTTPGARGIPVLERDDRVSFSRQAWATVIAHDRWITLQAPDGRHIVNSRVPWGQPFPFSSFSSEPPQNVRADPDQITHDVCAELAVRLAATGGSVHSVPLGAIRPIRWNCHQLTRRRQPVRGRTSLLYRRDRRRTGGNRLTFKAVSLESVYSLRRNPNFPPRATA